MVATAVHLQMLMQRYKEVVNHCARTEMNSQSMKMLSDQVQSPSQGKGGTKDHHVCQVLAFGGEKSLKSHLGDTDPDSPPSLQKRNGGPESASRELMREQYLNFLVHSSSHPDEKRRESCLPCTPQITFYWTLCVTGSCKKHSTCC